MAEVSDRLECATLITPLDWENPEAGQLDFPIARVRAANEVERQGAILFNPGGPGKDGLASGVNFALTFAAPDPEAPAAELLSQVSERYDVIGFTPRGVGETSLLTCGVDENNAQDILARFPKPNFYTDRSEENVQKFLDGARIIAELCAGDPLAPYINTEQTVQDMDLIRRLLEDEKLNYFGYSYGTWLGAWYAKEFPEHVGNFVLDSNVEFSATWQETNFDRVRANERAFRDVALPYVVRNGEPYGLGTDIEALYNIYDALPRRFKAAIEPGGADEQTALTLVVAKGIGEVVASLEDPEDRDALVAGLETYTFAENSEINEEARGSALALVEEAEAIAETGTLALLVAPFNFTAVLCNDSPWTQDPNFWVEKGDELNERYPLAGGRVTFEPCAFWSFPSASMPDVPDTIPPVLMVQNGYDTQTPAEGALNAFRSLPNAKLVYVENEAKHLVFPYNTECVDTSVAAYLLEGTLPEDDVTNCPAKPLLGEDQVYPPGTAPSIGSQGAAAQTAEPGPANPRYERLRERVLEDAGFAHD